MVFAFAVCVARSHEIPVFMYSEIPALFELVNFNAFVQVICIFLHLNVMN